MGYCVSIDSIDIRCDHDINKELSELDHWYMSYYQNEGGSVWVNESSFKWNEAFVTDLLRLRELGVRGTCLNTGPLPSLFLCYRQYRGHTMHTNNKICEI